MSEEAKTAEKPKPRRRLGPPRSRKKPDGWEDIREDDLLELPAEVIPANHLLHERE